MNCACHGQPAYWNVDLRKPCRGYWRCAVKKTAYQRDRYDGDPVYRIEKNLHDRARKRGVTLERRRAAYLTEGADSNRALQE